MKKPVKNSQLRITVLFSNQEEIDLLQQAVDIINYKKSDYARDIKRAYFIKNSAIKAAKGIIKHTQNKP